MKIRNSVSQNHSGFLTISTLILAVLLLAATVRAQVAFQIPDSYAVGTNPAGIATGDFNRDGKSDIVVVDGGGVSVLLNDGFGQFNNQVDSPTPNPGWAIATGDFNRDGKLDLAVTHPFANKVSLLLGLGNGHFSLGSISTTGTNPRGVTVTDLNNDGKPDVVVTNFSGNTISVLLGNGNGTLQAKQDVAMAAGPLALASGDFNRDGKPDVVVTSTSPSSKLTLLPGKGDGGFWPKQEFLAGGYPASVCTGDFNQDGRLDVATANAADNSVSILLGQSSFFWLKPKTDYPAGGPAYALAAADYDGDGKLDLAVGQKVTPNYVRVLTGDGLGGLSAPHSFAIKGTNSYFIATADFNGDARPDLVTANYVTNDVAVLINDALFPPATTFCAKSDYAVGDSPVDVATADLNLDGVLDLVVINNGAGMLSNTVSVMLGKNDGTFEAQQNYPTGPRPSAVAIGDFNRDGKPDLAATNNNVGQGNTVSVLLGNGNGIFNPKQDYLTGVSPKDIVAGDFNRDGKLDLAVANGNSNTVSMLLGKGDGTFLPKLDAATNLMPYSLVAEDFNRDGMLDLAVVCMGANPTSVVRMMFGIGTGEFALPADYAVGNLASYLTAGDFNRDGVMDVAVSNNQSNTISILQGHTDGSYTASQLIPTGNASSPLGVKAGDFDRDGKLDLAFVCSNSNQVRILPGFGDGTFGAYQSYWIATGAFQLAVGDFNGDGRLDVAAANSNADSVSVLLRCP